MSNVGKLSVLLVLTCCCAYNAEAYTFPSAGAKLESLPLHKYFQGQPARSNVDLSLVVERFEFFPDENTTLSFYGLAYRDNVLGVTSVMGPTIRAKAGDVITIKIANEVVAPNSEEIDTQLQYAIANVTGGNGFHNAFATNMHLHGMHGSPGLMLQPNITSSSEQSVMLLPNSYTGGDNVLVQIPAKQSPEDPAAFIVYKNAVPEDHFPGLGWYHPHHHGGVTLQASTAKGMWLIEDDNDAFLSEDPGCEGITQIFETAEERLLAITTLTFTSPIDPPIQDKPQNEVENGDLDYDDLASLMDIPNFQFIGLATNDPYYNQGNYTTELNNQQYAFINGAYQPVIDMKSGVYQRWRMVNVDVQNFFEVQVLREHDNQLAQCEMGLYAKDGVYIMDLPRPVPMLLLSQGSRAEFVIRCFGGVGTKYRLVSGMGPDFSDPLDSECDAPHCLQFAQVLATIEITEADEAVFENEAQLVAEVCQPLRPAYASDLRDQSLTENDAWGSVVQVPVSLTDNPAFGCLVNKEWFKFPVANPIPMELGTVTEVNFQYLNAHATHIHINPFQIVALPHEAIIPGTKYSAYYKVGDWHDTLLMLQLEEGSNVTTRIQPGPYTGYAVVHCHILPHEDEGCMKLVQWKCPGYDNEQPFPCPNFEFPVPGTVNKTMYPDRNPLEPVDEGVVVTEDIAGVDFLAG